MKHSKILLTILIFIFSSQLSSCKFLDLGDDVLVLKKRPYLEDNLNLNGYYYCDCKDSYRRALFFYQNGVIFDIGAYPVQDSLIIEDKLKDPDWLAPVKEGIFSWGIFNIDSNIVQFERYYPSSGEPFEGYIRSGEILNDTTFHITKSTRSNGSMEYQEDEVYHFKKFSPKPDSVNKYY